MPQHSSLPVIQIYITTALNIDMDHNGIKLALMDDVYYCVSLLVMDLIAFGVGMLLGIALYIW